MTTPESDDPHPAEYSLACPFLTDDPVYAHGVEFGMLWARMSDPRNTDLRETIRTENSEQVRVAAARLGWDLVDLREWEDGPPDNGWVFVRLVRRPS